MECNQGHESCQVISKLNLETCTRPWSIPGKSVLPQVRTRSRPKKNLGKKDYWRYVLPRGSLLRMSNSGANWLGNIIQASGRTPASRFLLREAPAPTPASIPTSRSIKGITRSYDLPLKWKTHTYDAWKIFDNRRNGLAQAIVCVLPKELTRLLSGREHITYNAKYCLRSLHAYYQAGSILHIMQSTARGAYTLTLRQGAYYITCKVLRKELTRLLLRSGHRTKYANSYNNAGGISRNAKYCIQTQSLYREKQWSCLGRQSTVHAKTNYSGFLRTPGLKITSGLLDQDPLVINNLRVPKQSPGPEKISGPGKGKPPGSYIIPGSKRPLGPKYDLRSNLRVQNDLRVLRNLRVQNDLWILNTTSGSEGTSGFPNNLRVLTQPPDSKSIINLRVQSFSCRAASELQKRPSDPHDTSGSQQRLRVLKQFHGSVRSQDPAIESTGKVECDASLYSMFMNLTHIVPSLSLPNCSWTTHWKTLPGFDKGRHFSKKPT
ncbi:LOW QUALITY PROTEIN: hypothetical protein YC2023_117443 [Brassica napus]